MEKYEEVELIGSIPLRPSAPYVFNEETFGKDYCGPRDFTKEDDKNE